jgi:hypothetical protein
LSDEKNVYNISHEKRKMYNNIDDTLVDNDSGYGITSEA